MSDDADPPQRDYRETVFLPNTPFPMRAGLPTAEPIQLERLGDLTSRAASVAERRPDELGPLLQTIIADIRSEKPAGLAGVVRRLWGRRAAPRRAEAR